MKEVYVVVTMFKDTDDQSDNIHIAGVFYSQFHAYECARQEKLRLFARESISDVHSLVVRTHLDEEN